MMESNRVSAVVLKDSMYNASRLVTLELEYPRYIHCFDDETEILCRHSADEVPLFRKFSEVYNTDVEVAQSTVDGEISFTTPLSWIKRYTEENLLSLDYQRLNFMVTKEHRLLVGSRKGNGRYDKEIIKAKELLGKHTLKKFYKDGSLKEDLRSDISPELAKLIAYFVSDGHIPLQKGRQAWFRFKKDRKIKEVMRLLDKLDIPYKETKYEDGVTSIVLDKTFWMEQCYTSSREKKLPAFIWNMSTTAFNSFIEGLLESDGNVANREYNNCSEVLIDQLQALLHINNLSFNKKSYMQEGHRNIFKVKIQKEDTPTLRSDKQQIKEVPYKGYVYCVTVPTSLIMVRRRGIVHISGNCELMTHRVFSRNAQSSRAIPINKAIERIENDEWYPIFMENKKGMSADTPLVGVQLVHARNKWDAAKSNAINTARSLCDIGVHKQVANRVLEPFSKIKVILSSTEWNNFFRQRLDIAAQQEMAELAIAIRNAMSLSHPTKLDVGQWHLPFIRDSEEIFDLDILRKVSVARCARVSYLGHDGNNSIEADVELFNRLKTSGHWSPFEHVATPLPVEACGGNFKRYRQFRWYVENGSMVY